MQSRGSVRWYVLLKGRRTQSVDVVTIWVAPYAVIQGALPPSRGWRYGNQGRDVWAFVFGLREGIPDHSTNRIHLITDFFFKQPPK